jgi:hypothetical protein
MGMCRAAPQRPQWEAPRTPGARQVLQFETEPKALKKLKIPPGFGIGGWGGQLYPRRCRAGVMFVTPFHLCGESVILPA